MSTGHIMPWTCCHWPLIKISQCLPNIIGGQYNRDPNIDKPFKLPRVIDQRSNGSIHYLFVPVGKGKCLLKTTMGSPKTSFDINMESTVNLPNSQPYGIDFLRDHQGSTLPLGSFLNKDYHINLAFITRTCHVVISLHKFKQSPNSNQHK